MDGSSGGTKRELDPGEIEARIMLRTVASPLRGESSCHHHRPFKLLSPLGERLGEGVMQEKAFDSLT
jgi:hypothetical protein